MGEAAPEAGWRWAARASPLRSQILLVAALGGQLILGVVLTALLGRVLRPEELGFFTLLSTLLMVAPLVLDPGWSGVVVREIARAPDRERALVEGLMAVQGAGGVLLALVPVVGLVGAEPSRRAVLLAVACVLPLVAVNAVRPAFRLRQAAGAPVALSLLGPALVLAGAAVLAARNAPGGAYAWLLVGREAVAQGWLWVLARGVLGYGPRPALRLRGFAPVVRGAAVYGAAVLVYQLSLHADVLFVRVLGGESELGAYAAALRPLAPLMQVPHLLAAALLPMLAVAAAAGTPGPLVRELGVLFASLGAVAGATCLAFSRDFLAVLYGGVRYVEGGTSAVAVFGWLGVAVGGAFAAAPYVTALLADGRERHLLALSFGGLALKVVGNLVLLPRMALEGAAITSAVAALSLAGLAWGGWRRLHPGSGGGAVLVVLGPAAVVLGAGALVPGSTGLRATLGAALALAAATSILAMPRMRRLLRRLAAPTPPP